MRSLRTVAGLNVSVRLHSFRCAIAFVCLAWCGGSQSARASSATATTLSITSGGNAVSSVDGGTVITLIATVQVGATALTLGQVNFCDAAAASCTDIHLLGTAQLTSAGTAILRFRPGSGSHSYKAVFLGTLAGAASSSAAVGLTVGPRPPGLQTTFTVAAVTGPDATNKYALTASVGTKAAIPPSGTVSFLDSDNGDSQLETAMLGPVSGGASFLNVPIPEPIGGGADAIPIVAIADFNGDGIPDVLSAPHGGIAISLGNGDGTFAAPLVPNLDAGDGINAFGVGDFNGDGITDLVVVDEDTGKLTVLLGNGDGTFAAGQTLSFSTISIAVADFNGDGKLDLALAGSSQTTILLGNGDGTFTAAPNPPQIGTSQLVAADFNGDGELDLALAGSSQTTILLGNGDGTFTAAPNPPQIGTSQLVAADFNGDGKIDLAAVGASVTILAGNGDGTFTAASTFPTGSDAFALAVGDFNGDGKADLAVAGRTNNPNETVTIFEGNGDGTFAAGINVPAFPESLAAADLTGNGSWDLATFGSVLLGNLTISTATLDTNLSAGYNIIQANYPGDASNAPSASNPNEATILVPQPVFSLTSNPIMLVPGTSASGSFSVTSLSLTGTVNLSCAISAPQSQANPPTCSVPPSVNLFSANAAVNLTYTITTQATTSTGQYSVTITAMYPAGGVPPASTSAAVSVGAQNYLLTNSGATIASPGASGSSTITISPVGGYTGQVTLHCAVTGGPSGAVNPLACTIPSPISVAGSQVNATLTLNTQPTTTPGSYTVSVTGASAGSVSSTTSFSVNVPAPAPGFTLSSTAVTIASPGASGSSTITISPVGGYTGQVTLHCAVTGGPSGAVNPLACTIPSPISVAGSQVNATLTLNTQPTTTPGSYTVSVTGASAGSVSSTTSFNVNVPAPAPGFTLSSTAVTIVSPGPSGTSTITIRPSGGFTGSVALSCAVTGGLMGRTDAPTCSVTSPPAIAGNTAVTATLTISTTAASPTAYRDPAARTQDPPRVAAIGGSAVVMASLLLFGFPIRRRRTMTQLGLLLIAIFIGAAIGCGGKNAATPPANPGTTPGTYIVTVTGSSGSIMATTAVSVTVN